MTVTGLGRPGAGLTDTWSTATGRPLFFFTAPKSTGKEYFNFGYVSSRLPEGRDLTRGDLLASLTAASAEMTAMAPCRPFNLDELIVAGGGTRNPTF